jgi:hypothetical protein
MKKKITITGVQPPAYVVTGRPQLTKAGRDLAPYVIPEENGEPPSISWIISGEDHATVLKIAERARALFRKHKVKPVPALHFIVMDLTATHSNGCPLRLAELLEATDANLLHDVAGIRRHLNRDTGQLGGCFLPRYSAPR